MNKALTKEQSDFAAEHHGTVEKFLRKHGYPFDEFYDTVIFGYLDAVKAYFEKEGLSEKYSFTTLAYRSMRFRAIDLIRAQNRKKRKANVLGYDEDMYGDSPGAASEPERALLEKEDAARILKALDHRQRGIIDLKTFGYKTREIVKLLGVTPNRVRSESAKVRAHVRTALDIAA
jgi:RNA polymerase sigma factor (sigma-70 family)